MTIADDLVFVRTIVSSLANPASSADCSRRPSPSPHPTVGCISRVWCQRLAFLSVRRMQRQKQAAPNRVLGLLSAIEQRSAARNDLRHPAYHRLIKDVEEPPLAILQQRAHERRLAAPSKAPVPKDHVAHAVELLHADRLTFLHLDCFFAVPSDDRRTRERGHREP